PDVHKYLKDHRADNSHYNQHTGPVGSLGGARNHSRQEQSICQQQRNTADKARVFSGYRKNEISVRLRQKFQNTLRSFRVALYSRKTAFAYSDFGLDRMIAVSLRVDTLGVDNSVNAILLIYLDLACPYAYYPSRGNENGRSDHSKNHISHLYPRKKKHGCEYRKVCDGLSSIRFQHYKN